MSALLLFDGGGSSASLLIDLWLALCAGRFDGCGVIARHLFARFGRAQLVQHGSQALELCSLWLGGSTCAQTHAGRLRVSSRHCLPVERAVYHKRRRPAARPQVAGHSMTQQPGVMYSKATIGTRLPTIPFKAHVRPRRAPASRCYQAD